MIKIKKALLVLCAFCAISSQNLDDIFHAHIGGVDNFARALITADNILTSSNYKELFNLRYNSFNSGKGKAFEQGKLNLY